MSFLSVTKLNFCHFSSICFPFILCILQLGTSAISDSSSCLTSITTWSACLVTDFWLWWSWYYQHFFGRWLVAFSQFNLWNIHKWPYKLLFITAVTIRSFSSSSTSFDSYDFHLKVRTRSSLGKVEGIWPFRDIVFESSTIGDCCESHWCIWASVSSRGWRLMP